VRGNFVMSAPATLSESSQSEKPSEEAIAEAVAAYNAGKTPAAAGRFARAKWILPTGIILLLLGGLLSVLGSYLMVKGFLKAYALTGILSGNAGAGDDLMKPVADYSKLLQDLLQEPGNRHSPGPIGPGRLMPAVLVKSGRYEVNDSGGFALRGRPPGRAA